ncbi:MAG: hypothetical protein OEZ03_06400 [Alphaproteobacteria bacterium]|nr:hypothetical protein [Alphaproteobacteria bacterium]
MWNSIKRTEKLIIGKHSGTLDIIFGNMSISVIPQRRDTPDNPMAEKDEFLILPKGKKIRG